MMHYNDIPRALEAVLSELHKETSAAFDTLTLTRSFYARDAVDKLLDAQREVITAMDLYDAAKRLMKEEQG